MLFQVAKHVIHSIGIVALADFVSGFVHWAEDSYGNVDTPILGKHAIEPNLRHHRYPREFLRNGYWQSSWDLWMIGMVVLAIAWFFNALGWEVCLFVALAVNANQFHKWAHRNRTENGLIVTALQRARLLPTQAHHAGHHRGLRNSHYCTVTNFVNPVADKLDLWRGLERLITRVSGVLPRVDTGAMLEDPRLAKIRAERLRA